MNFKHSAVRLLLSSSLILAACGDDDADGGGGGGGINSGLPEDQKLSSLDDDDAKTACENTARSFEASLPSSEIQRATCAMFGISFAKASGETDQVAQCKMFAQECEDAAADEDEGDVTVGVPNED